MKSFSLVSTPAYNKADELPSPNFLPQAAEQRSAPFRQFVLKIASRCNLSCSYCYMYEMSDDSWREQPRHMAPATVRAVAQRISEHVDAHQLRNVQVVLHGGEPLLAGPARLAALAAELRDAVKARVDLRVQTNGTLLSTEMIDVLA